MLSAPLKGMIIVRASSPRAPIRRSAVCQRIKTPENSRRVKPDVNFRVGYDGGMRSLPREKAEFFQVVAARIVPEVSQLDDQGRGRFYSIIDDALQNRDESVRRQFGVFLGVLRWASLIRYGSPFEKLSPERQDSVLRWFEDCSVSLLRKGFWGLKAMVFMGYYGQPETNQAVGYAPEVDGKGGLHA